MKLFVKLIDSPRQLAIEDVAILSRRERQSVCTHRYFDDCLIETILPGTEFNLTEWHLTQT